MKRLSLLALALVAGAATPAFADWDNIGSVHVDYGVDRDTASPDFGGPVERLQFTATGGDVQCKSIRAFYTNGQSSELYSGMLRMNNPRGADLPGSGRGIRKIDFLCRSFDRNGANIRMDADIGQYRAQWRASPEWNRTWSRLLHWAGNTTAAVSSDWKHTFSDDHWVLIGTANFTGPNDRDGGAAGQAGRGITDVGFKANADAVCSRVVIRLGSGAERTYAVNNGQPMRRGQFYSIDLPGESRHVTNVMLRCRALGQYAVSVNIYGNK
ncbi:MAG TPA: hypothetical protein VGF56_03705 [Rhizomicrobium sp.]|jgi:hypothetical protein